MNICDKSQIKKRKTPTDFVKNHNFIRHYFLNFILIKWFFDSSPPKRVVFEAIFMVKPCENSQRILYEIRKDFVKTHLFWATWWGYIRVSLANETGMPKTGIKQSRYII